MTDLSKVNELREGFVKQINDANAKLENLKGQTKVTEVTIEQLKGAITALDMATRAIQAQDAESQKAKAEAPAAATSESSAEAPAASSDAAASSGSESQT